jgi:hypothetical protein
VYDRQSFHASRAGVKRNGLQSSTGAQEERHLRARRKGRPADRVECVPRSRRWDTPLAVCVRSAKLAAVTDGSGRRGSVARFLRTARGRLTVVPPSGSGVLPAQIDGVDTSTAAFVGTAASGAPAAAVEVRSLVDHDRAFGTADGELRRAVRLFFDNGGRRAFVAGTTGQLSDGLDLLNNVRFSVLAIPGAASLDPADAAALLVDAVDLCEERRAFLVVDPPEALPSATRWPGFRRSARRGTPLRISRGCLPAEPRPPHLAPSPGSTRGPTWSGVFGRRQRARPSEA